MSRVTGVILSLLSLLAVGALVAWEWQSGHGSPGPLSPVHAGLHDGAAISCDGCHGVAGSDMATACATCHAPIAEQLREKRGLHGRLDSTVAARCGHCHAEHLGGELPLVTETAFRRAGYASAADYVHDNHYLLTGAHTELACQKCHERAHDPWVSKGSSRFLGNEQQCHSCHDDSHDGSYGDRCTKCHDQTHPFADATSFVHDSFALSGGHADVACARCHESTGRHSVAALLSVGAAQSHVAIRPCAECHENPHTVTGTAVFLPSASACGECHDTSSFRGVQFGVEEHATHGVVLAGAHATAPCSGCHDRGDLQKTPAGEPVPRDVTSCDSCHENPHTQNPHTQGSHVPGGALTFRDSNRCSDCHGVQQFAPVTVNSGDHERFGLQLTGVHRGHACAVCHAAAEQAGPEQAGEAGEAGEATLADTRSVQEPKWAGAPAQGDCHACHAAPHRAEFLAQVQQMLAPAGPAESCVSCHAEDAATFRLPDAACSGQLHEASGFSLDPPHAGLECSACHAPELSFEVRYPGRQADDCAACHGQPHAAVFNDPSVSTWGCLECHDAHRFQPTHFNAATHARLQFPLHGKHAQVPCADCHGLDVTKPTWGDPPQACAACHDDVHGGHFARPRFQRTIDGRAGCARCHQESGFADLRQPFDHDTWTDFPLSGSHADLACVKCHDTSDGRRRLTSSCADCHDDPHAGQFRRNGTTDCSSCHRDSTRFDRVVLDHDRTRFPLDATHEKVPCQKCHKPSRTQAGKLVTRYRPLGTECKDCHGWSE